MPTRTVDSKGRITLGRDFANQTVVIDESNPNQLVIRKMVLIPAEEAWLYKNHAAMKSLRKGLEQASKMQFSDSPPDVDTDADDAE
jgi:hypothetical protein